MKAITVGMIIYCVVCAVLVVAVSLYQDLKRHRELHQHGNDNPVIPPGDTTLHLESREIRPPRQTPRTRHAA